MTRVSRVSRVAWRRAAVLLLALVLVACEPGGDARPSPTASTPGVSGRETAAGGLRVAVVLAPPVGVAAIENRSVRNAAEDVEDDEDLDIAEIDVLAPPDEPFRRDQIAFAAERGADLVCTIGSDGADDVAALAPRFPRTSFCLVDGTLTEPPGNVVALAWDLRQGAFLAGAAAALARPDASAGIVVRSPSATFDAVRTGFDAGARTVRSELRIVVGTVPTGADASDDPAGARATADGIHGGEPPVRAVLPYGGPDLVAGVAEVFAPDGFLIGWGADLGDVLVDLEDLEVEDAAEHVVVSIVKRYDLALRGVIATVTEDEELPTLGVEAYALVPGGARDAYEAVRPRLERLVGDIAAGNVQTSLPPPPSPAAGAS